LQFIILFRILDFEYTERSIVKSKRKVANPLALAVMATLAERPLHPYQISSLLKQRVKHESIRLNYGSLYSVVDALEREGLIVPHETEREGRRPERTVYELTPAGHTELDSWLRELIRIPVKEYPQFAAGLSLMARLPKEEALELLTERRSLLEQKIATEQARNSAAASGAFGFAVPRLFMVENEYELAQWQAEVAWLRNLEEEIKSGVLPWPRHRVENGRDIIVMPDGTELVVPLP
jgi:DNA-binding PadR family transcriptional regulator